MKRKLSREFCVICTSLYNDCSIKGKKKYARKKNTLKMRRKKKYAWQNHGI